MNRLIIVGSPRANGRSAALAELLFEMCIAECPDDEVALAPVSTLGIAPCTACDCCRDAVRDADGDADAEGMGVEGSAWPPCAIDDDMGEVRALMDAADELVVVSPVFFAGPPAQLKALLDRLQPYFWTDARLRPKRPATLHVVGEGGDPHGFLPLVGAVRSALSCAGFSLERVLDWVGKIDAEGEIVAEADEVGLDRLGGSGRMGLSEKPPVGDDPLPVGEEGVLPPADESSSAAPARVQGKPGARPVLRLGSNRGAAGFQKPDHPGKAASPASARSAGPAKSARSPKGPHAAASPKGPAKPSKRVKPGKPPKADGSGARGSKGVRGGKPSQGGRGRRR